MTSTVASTSHAANKCSFSVLSANDNNILRSTANQSLLIISADSLQGPNGLGDCRCAYSPTESVDVATLVRSNNYLALINVDKGKRMGTVKGSLHLAISNP